MTQAGPVLVAVVVLWIAYLVPHRVRYRQQLLESRSDDRFSEGLRVLRVARAAGAGAPGAAADAAPSTRVLLHPARPGGGALMHRPHARTDRAVVADAVAPRSPAGEDVPRGPAGERARRAAHLARRAAAARRRAALTAVLLLATVVAWVVVATTGAGVLVGLAPTAALVGVLALGRRAVVAAARADAQGATGPSGPALPAAAGAGTRTVGRAVHPSDASTQVMARVSGGSTASRSAVEAPVVTSAGAETATAGTQVAGAAVAPVAGGSSTPAAHPDGGAAAAAVGSEAGSWSPVPVPRPAYTLKAAAPRREPAPLVLDDPAVSDAARVTADVTLTTAAAPAEGSPASTPAAPGAAATPALDLDAILARRRASGE